MKLYTYLKIFALMYEKKFKHIFAVIMIFINIILFSIMPGYAAEGQVETGIEQNANVKEYGAKGDGITDDTSAFRAAIATGLPVYLPSTDKCYIISDSLYLQNSITFADHAKIQMRIDFSIKYACYRWKDTLVVENMINQNTLYINNPQIDGGWAYAGCPLNWGEQDFWTGDSGHAISIRSSTNVKVVGGYLTNLGGDGVFLGIDRKVPAAAVNYSPNDIYVDGTIIENPDRMCLCLEAGKNCTFNNIKGYKHNNYVAAIDIEPNTRYPSATIDNLVVDNCHIVSDGSNISEDSVTQYGLSFVPKAEPFEIDCSSTAGHYWGHITVKNSTFQAANCMAARCQGEVNSDYFTKHLTFDKCDFESNYGAFFLWGKDVTVKDCVANLTSDVHRNSTITDLSNSGKCMVTIDNLKYNCLGDSQVFIYQMGKATVRNSEIIIKSVSPMSKETYSALYIRNCKEFSVENCTLNSMRNALMFTGTNEHFSINNNTLIPNISQKPYHYCVWARPTGTVDYNIDGNVFDTDITGTDKQMIESSLPGLKGDFANTINNSKTILN